MTHYDSNPKKMAPRKRLPRSKLVDRDRYLVQACSGKRVIHLACAAWPFTDALERSGQLLHCKLGTVTRQLAGIDLQRQALQLLRSRGYTELYSADLLNSDEFSQVVKQLTWTPDVLIAGELIEHLDQPATLLRNCASLMSPEAVLIITVPNAFAIKGFLHTLTGHEKVSEDHVAYYSLMSMRQLVSRSGLHITSTCWYRSSSKAHPIEQVIDVVLWPLLRLRPQLADGLIVTCRSTRPTGDTRSDEHRSLEFRLPSTFHGGIEH